jgi:CheY-like chemotaxis protein
MKPPDRPAILIVDDDRAVLRVLSRILGREYDVHEANSATEAVARLDQRGFALVLSDLDMPPGPDGIEVLRVAQDLHPHAGRILLTAATRPDLIGHLRSGLVERILAKPGSPEVVRAAVARYSRNG